MRRQEAEVAVVGAGIVGLSHAWAAAARGRRVVVFERTARAVGASVRNFGLPWPIGLALTPLYDRALFSRERWRLAAAAAGFACVPNGALFLAYARDEAAVLAEFTEMAGGAHRLLDPAGCVDRSSAVNPQGLVRGLYSHTELTVDPRDAVARLAVWLAREHGVIFRFGTPVRAIQPPLVETPDESWRVDHTFVCSGQDFETLYPQAFTASGLTRCKLQMLRLAPQPADWTLGPTLCAGLTIARYDNFAACPTTPALRERLARDLPEHTAWGIHVMLAQNGRGELVTGDTHEYGLTVDPFDSEHANQLILDYLGAFARIPNPRILERWHGIYPKLAGQSEWVHIPEPGVTIVQITNGLGMTLAFGLAEEIVEAL